MTNGNNDIHADLRELSTDLKYVRKALDKNSDDIRKIAEDQIDLRGQVKELQSTDAGTRIAKLEAAKNHARGFGQGFKAGAYVIAAGLGAGTLEAGKAIVQFFTKGGSSP